MMFSYRFLGGLIAVASLVAAVPSEVVQRAPKSYYLKTKVLSGDHKLDGLYIYSYHTGAGLSDAALTSNISIASKGLLNATNQEFTLTGTTIPFGLELAYTAYYTSWLPVEINAGYGDSGFSFNSTGLISSNVEWAGWIACDWWHGVPQLFFQYYYKSVTVPSSCAHIELLPVAA